jgi:hypothetical protein
MDHTTTTTAAPEIRQTFETLAGLVHASAGAA